MTRPFFLGRRLFLAFLSVVVLTACGDEAAKPAEAPPAAPDVALARFDALRFFPERTAPATALGKNEARLAPEVSARVIAIHVDAGDRVAAGQVLARLDPRDAELALARAEAALGQSRARLAQAEAQLRRARALREKGFYSAEALTLRETDFAAASADEKAARAARDTAAHALEKCTLRAPFPGIVRARAGQVGELAVPGTPLLTLADTREVQLVAQVQARDAEGMAAAAAFEFVTPDARHAVKPLRVSPAISRESRTVEARFAFAGPAPAPGSEGRLAWREARAHLAPEFLLRRNGKYGVFVAESGKARFHLVPGAQEGRPAAADLADDAQVVTQGRHALQDGAVLNPRPAR